MIGDRRGIDGLFLGSMAGVLALYTGVILLLLIFDAWYTTPGILLQALQDPEIAYSIRLSVFSCTITALLSVAVAVPAGYVMSRFRFTGHTLVEAILDVPIILPPLVIGLSLLILFQTRAGRAIESAFQQLTGSAITFDVPGVILAQFMVACAFAVRSMRSTFDQLSPRTEQVALTLGCTRGQAFWNVVLPEAWRGVLAAGTLAWARALGEFGPILIFAGIMPRRTAVMSSSVYLEFSIGRLPMAMAISYLMILVAFAVLLLVRWLGSDATRPGTRGVL